MRPNFRWMWEICCLVAAGCNTSPPVAVTESIASPASPAATAAPVAIEDAEQRVAGEPVTAILKLSPSSAKSGDTLTLSVILQIAPTWEIHPLDSTADDGAATQIELTLPDGLKSDEPWQAPEPGRSAMPDGHPAHAGEVVFTKTVLVTPAATAGEHDLRCRVKFTACDERRCLRPMPVDLTVPLRIE